MKTIEVLEEGIWPFVVEDIEFYCNEDDPKYEKGVQLARVFLRVGREGESLLMRCRFPVQGSSFAHWFYRSIGCRHDALKKDMLGRSGHCKIGIKESHYCPSQSFNVIEKFVIGKWSPSWKER